LSGRRTVHGCQRSSADAAKKAGKQQGENIAVKKSPAVPSLSIFFVTLNAIVDKINLSGYAVNITFMQWVINACADFPAFTKRFLQSRLIERGNPALNARIFAA
jgi:hypothetical protein